jgi:PhzF family phenazine biosynthesis protein
MGNCRLSFEACANRVASAVSYVYQKGRWHDDPVVAIFQVDAFTSEAYQGNPAAVCLLDSPAEETWMQLVAAEMNLSETAFVTADDPRGLRWFTPLNEVELCGHATLASAHVLWSEGHEPRSRVLTFETRSGILRATSIDDGWVELDLPARSVTEGPLEQEIVNALGVEPVRTATSSFDLVEVATEAEVLAARPDLSVLAARQRGYILTAESAGEVVCRVFAPGYGIPEDPVTGSAQCVLGPWWAPRLGVDNFVTRQLSRRGGIIRVRIASERVHVAGQAITTVRGDLLT